jgi:stress-induced morphogen
LSDEVIYETGVCQNCLIKFNEYDELITRAECIQVDLIKLMERKLSPQEKVETDEDFKIKTEENDYDPIEFAPEMDNLYFVDEEQAELEHSSIIQETEGYQVEVVVDDTKENIIDIGRRSQALKTALQSAAKEKIIKAEDKSEYVTIELENNQLGYQCDICSKVFKDKSKLKIHREIHTTERNVICQECGKGFKTLNCLRNHKRMHMPERTYFGCDKCEKKYTQKVQLKKHIEIVHMNRR